jgi:hypothetical protein
MQTAYTPQADLDGCSCRYYGNTMPVISLKVSAADARRIRALARARRTTVSAYLRGQALPPPAATDRRISLRKHPASGLSYDASPRPAVTDDDIRAALADFP